MFVRGHCFHPTGRGIRLTGLRLEEVSCCYCEAAGFWDLARHTLLDAGPFAPACLTRTHEQGWRRQAAQRARHRAPAVA